MAGLVLFSPNLRAHVASKEVIDGQQQLSRWTVARGSGSGQKLSRRLLCRCRSPQRALLGAASASPQSFNLHTCSSPSWLWVSAGAAAAQCSAGSLGGSSLCSSIGRQADAMCSAQRCPHTASLTGCPAYLPGKAIGWQELAVVQHRSRTEVREAGGQGQVVLAQPSAGGGGVRHCGT